MVVRALDQLHARLRLQSRRKVRLESNARMRRHTGRDKARKAWRFRFNFSLMAARSDGESGCSRIVCGQVASYDGRNRPLVNVPAASGEDGAPKECTVSRHSKFEK